jgi:hypothetical protein
MRPRIAESYRSNSVMPGANAAFVAKDWFDGIVKFDGTPCSSKERNPELELSN